MQPTTLTFTLKNDSKELTKLSEALEKFGAALHFTPKCIFEINLIAEEVFTNIVDHAFSKCRGARHISFSCTCDGRNLEIWIEDDGIPFNPLQVEKPELEAPVEERTIGGLGIHLIRKFSDDIQYIRSGKKNILKIKKKIAEENIQKGDLHEDN